MADANTETTRPSASPRKDAKGVGGKKVESKDKSSENETPKIITWSDDDIAKLKKIFKDSVINNSISVDVNKFLVRLHGESNILVKLCGNTT